MGITISNPMNDRMVCRVKRVVCRLKVSSKKWNEKFTKVASTLGLKMTEHYVSLLVVPISEPVVLLLYVDHTSIAPISKSKLDEVEQGLNRVFLADRYG